MIDRGGRPPKLTLPVALSILADVAEGVSRDEAARNAGVGPSSLQRWMLLGRRGDPRYVDFARAVSANHRASFGRAAARSLVRLSRMGF